MWLAPHIVSLDVSDRERTFPFQTQPCLPKLTHLTLWSRPRKLAKLPEMPALQHVHWHSGPHIGNCKHFQVSGLNLSQRGCQCLHTCLWCII